MLLQSKSLYLYSTVRIGQGIKVGPGKFVKKNKRRVLNKGQHNEPSYLTKKPSNLKISQGHGKNYKI